MISGTGKTESNRMIGSVINGYNLHKACRKVLSNKGSAGIDGIPAEELSGYLDISREALLFAIDGRSENEVTSIKEQLAAFEKKREQIVSGRVERKVPAPAHLRSRNTQG